MNENSKNDNKVWYLVKNTSILAFSNFSSKFLVFLLVPLYTNVLNTSEVGTYDLVYTTIQLLFPILTLNIAEAVLRFMMDKENDRRQTASIGLILLLASSILVLLFIVCAKKFVAFQAINGIEGIVFLFYISYSLNQYMIQFTKGIEEVKKLGVASVIGTIAMVLFNILFLLQFKMGLAGFFYANILGQIIPAVFLLISTRIWNYISGRVSGERIKTMALFSMPLIFTSLGWWVNNASDRYIVTWVCGIAANGLLSVSYKIPSILNNVSQTFIQAWQISAIREGHNKDSNAFYISVYRYLCSFMIITSSMLIASTPFLGKLLFAKDFYVAWRYVPFLVMSTVFNTSAGFLGAVLIAKKDSRSMAVSSSIAAVININLNYILTLFIGIQGATIATAIASLSLFYFRLRKVNLQDMGSINFKFAISNIILIIESLCIIYLESVLATMGIAILVIIINRKEIVNILHKTFFGVKHKLRR